MKRTLIAALIATAFAVPAYAGHDNPGSMNFDFELLASNDQADAWRRWAEDFSNDMRASMGTMFSGRVDSGRVVKNAPYSAEVITENNQALADGNVISKKTSALVYRDAAGRTRQESGSEGKRTIYINDPVTSQRIVLTPGSKRAVVAPRTFTSATTSKHQSVIRINGEELRVEDGKVFIGGKEVTGKTDLKLGNKELRIEGEKIFVDGKDITAKTPKKVVSTVTGVDGETREEVRVQVIRSGDGHSIVVPMPVVPPVPPIAPMPPGGHVAPVPPVPPVPPAHVAPMMRFEGVGKLGKGTTSSLGTKDFDGVRAEGKQTVWTIPAGEIGNRAPINVVSESWYSPDLQLTVYSRYSDPRQGESIYRLAGIKRGEPSADLFRVPDGYETMSKDVEREKARAERDRERARQHLQRDQERLRKEQERLQKEQERLQKESERLKG
jgi:hypothetical protein